MNPFRGLALCALAAHANLFAQTKSPSDDAVAVTALRNPVDKSYRRMVEGMELFEKRHRLAPDAALRFKLLPRHRDTDMREVRVEVVGDSFTAPVALAPDNTFTLERRAAALKENASVRPNRKAKTMTWRAEIRTPGLPPDTRRLGDLRLECHVGMEAELVSRYPSVLGWVMGIMGGTREACESPEAPYLFFAERPLFSVTLSSGARRQVLSIGELYAGVAHGETPKEDLPYCDCEVLLDRAYSLPLGDRSWPDDALVEFQYMDGAGGDAPAAGMSTSDEVRALLGEGTKLRFDSGYEVWAYAYGPDKPRRRRTELVVLLAPSGAVLKTRLRPAAASA